MRICGATMLIGLLAGCGAAPQAFAAPDEPPAAGNCVADSTPDAYADCVDEFLPGPQASFGHDALPDIVLGPPDGKPGGGTDVASLGCGGRITLWFAEPIVDGPGPDFIVFENPFETGDTTFAEPAYVLVSSDGAAWFEFPCDLAGDGSWPPTGCAGIEPVSEENGDAFDLEELGIDEVRYVRLIDASEDYWGNRSWCSGPPAGFDLDAIAAVRGP